MDAPGSGRYGAQPRIGGRCVFARANSTVGGNGPLPSNKLQNNYKWGYQMKWLYVVMISLAACFALPASHALATTVISLSDESLTNLSDYIVHGVIESVEPVQISDKQILTRVSLSVKNWLKTSDEKTDTFVFYTRGGKIGDIVVTVPGEMQPIVSTEVVVFLEKVPRFDDVPMLLGLLQGAFFVEPQTASPEGIQQRSISRHLNDLAIHRVEGTPESDFAQSKSLDELLDRIQTTVGRTP